MDTPFTHFDLPLILVGIIGLLLIVERQMSIKVILVWSRYKGKR